MIEKIFSYGKNRLYLRSIIESELNRNYSGRDYIINNYKGNRIRLVIDNIKVCPSQLWDTDIAINDLEPQYSRLKFHRWFKSILLNTWMTFVQIRIETKSTNYDTLFCPEDINFKLMTGSLVHRASDEPVSKLTQVRHDKDKIISFISLIL